MLENETMLLLTQQEDFLIWILLQKYISKQTKLVINWQMVDDAALWAVRFYISTVRQNQFSFHVSFNSRGAAITKSAILYCLFFLKFFPLSPG